MVFDAVAKTKNYDGLFVSFASIFLCYAPQESRLGQAKDSAPSPPLSPSPGEGKIGLCGGGGLAMGLL